MNTYDTANGFPTRATVRVKDLQRASRRLAVIPLDPCHGRYLVASGTQAGQVYRVTIEPERLEGSCSCPWAQYGGINCKHVLAALRAHYGGQGSLSFWRTRSDARRQHRPVLTGDHLFATLRKPAYTTSPMHLDRKAARSRRALATMAQN